MPRQFLYDLSTMDLNATLYGPEQIREINPQRGDMEHLDAVIWASREQNGLVGRKIVRENEFWVPGHIPGRPLLPGVIMIEAAAQLAAFYTKKYLELAGFIGFGGTGPTKFRAEVRPGMTLILMAMHTGTRHGRVTSVVQGVVDGQMAFESEIIGVSLG